MISSNEGATGVNATRSFFPLNTACYYRFFCLFLSDSQGYTHSVLVLYHVILFPITLLSSCPVTRPDNADKGAPKTRVRQGGGHKRAATRSPLWHRWGHCATDEVCNSTCQFAVVVSRVLLICHSLETLPKFALVGKSAIGKMETKQAMVIFIPRLRTWLCQLLLKLWMDF